MKNVVAATNSSITFNKKNFWIDPISHNQYFVGVQYPEQDFESIDDVLEYPDHQPQPERSPSAAERGHDHTHASPDRGHARQLQPTIDLTMGVEGRDLGHVGDDVTRVLDKFGEPMRTAPGPPTTPRPRNTRLIEGSKIVAERRIFAGCRTPSATWRSG